MNSYCMTQIMTIRVIHSYITVSIQAIAAKILSMEEKRWGRTMRCGISWMIIFLLAGIKIYVDGLNIFNTLKTWSFLLDKNKEIANLAHFHNDRSTSDRQKYPLLDLSNVVAEAKV